MSVFPDPKNNDGLESWMVGCLMLLGFLALLVWFGWEGT